MNCGGKEFEPPPAGNAVLVSQPRNSCSANDAKRSRAEAKAKGEKRMFLQKVQEQKKGEDELAPLKVEKDKQAFTIAEAVVVPRVPGADRRRAGEDTEEVWDLLNRHDTLKSANTDLQGQVQEGEKAVDGMRSDLDALNLSAESAGAVSNRAVTGKRLFPGRVPHVEESPRGGQGGRRGQGQG